MDGLGRYGAYRIVLQFSPLQPNNSRPGKFGRWRVVDCFLGHQSEAFVFLAKNPEPDPKEMYMLTSKPYRKGVTVDPAKVHREYWRFVQERDLIYFGKAA